MVGMAAFLPVLPAVLFFLEAATVRLYLRAYNSKAVRGGLGALVSFRLLVLRGEDVRVILDGDAAAEVAAAAFVSVASGESRFRFKDGSS